MNKSLMLKDLLKVGGCALPVGKYVTMLSIFTGPRKGMIFVVNGSGREINEQLKAVRAGLA